MTDRELLELAAKAADLRIKWDDQNQTYATCNVHGDMFDDWNPLADDGDAFRLAVKLLFEIDMRRGCVAISHSNGIKIFEAFNLDPYAATRRAIVRAAAEIGKEMK